VRSIAAALCLLVSCGGEPTAPSPQPEPVPDSTQTTTPPGLGTPDGPDVVLPVPTVPDDPALIALPDSDAPSAPTEPGTPGTTPAAEPVPADADPAAPPADPAVVAPAPVQPVEPAPGEPAVVAPAPPVTPVPTPVVPANPPPAPVSGPTWSKIKAASWTSSGDVSHSDAGKVRIRKTTVGGVECWAAWASKDVSVAKLLDVVTDIEGVIKWSSAGVTVAQTLKRTSSRVIYYQFLDVPGWTMSADRFWFLDATIEPGTTRASMHWRHLVRGGPYNSKWKSVTAANPKAVEPPVNVGGWTFVRKTDTTRIDYYICTEPGGSIPAAVTSLATKQTLPDTLGDLVKEAKKRGG